MWNLKLGEKMKKWSESRGTKYGKRKSLFLSQTTDIRIPDSSWTTNAWHKQDYKERNDH